jgi:hypothetical protein
VPLVTTKPHLARTMALLAFGLRRRDLDVIKIMSHVAIKEATLGSA